jgi:hypothetical protein
MDRRAKLTHRQKCGMLAAENCNCSAFSLRRKRMGKLFAAKLRGRKGASHDNSSTSHDGGYAGEKSLTADPSHIRAAGLPVCTPL